MNRIPVILDVDTGLDDALAILCAADRPELDLLGIACVSGNVSIDSTYANTRYVAKLLGLKIPIAKGAAYPLANKILHAHEVHGTSGLGRVKIEPEYEKHILAASALYVKLLSEATEPVTIIATGPVTNLAQLIQNHPELHPKIKQISLMGGSLGEGNVTRYAEFNAHFDPEAFNIVLRSKIPLIMAGFQLTTNIRIDSTDLKDQILDPNPAQVFFLDLLDFYIENSKKRGFAQGGALHDSVAVAAIATPDLFKTEQKSLVIDLSKDEHRGEVREEGELDQVSVLVEADKKALIQMTLDSIRHLSSLE
jgi:pyrimidine-specific ribonucleoside hydrolase